MQFAPQSEHPWRPAASKVRPRASQVLLIGFDDRTSALIADRLVALDLDPRINAEPLNGLWALIEDPDGWMACIMEAQAFVSDSACQRYLQLFSFELQTVGLILGNADTKPVAGHRVTPILGVDRVVQDIRDPAQFHDAVTAVLSRSGVSAARRTTLQSHPASRRASPDSMTARLKIAARDQTVSHVRRLSPSTLPT